MAVEFAGRLKVIEAELADVVSRLERLYEALETSQLEQRRVDLPGTEEIK